MWLAYERSKSGPVLVSNSSCSIEFDHLGKDNSGPLRVASLAYGCTACVLILATLSIWYKRHKHPYLRSRSLTIISLTSMGLSMELIASPFVRAIPERMPCELVAFCSYVCGVFLVSEVQVGDESARNTLFVLLHVLINMIL